MTSAPVKITILVGTMTGTAHLVAQELELAWDDAQFQEYGGHEGEGSVVVAEDFVVR